MDKNRKNVIIVNVVAFHFYKKTLVIKYQKGYNMGKNRKVFQSLTLILQFGLNMIVPILMCTMFGVWLGNKYDIPVITVPLFIVGALAGFTNIFKMAKKIYGQDSDRNNVKKTK